ncbi:MAG TPA: exo-beta-N-acetylmuramidase NamZ domain-containing protein, partial [Pyrinomonadaceae bacterium]|nr:exo-beta-N-acetylmuramidase NamZ domain-containing protein [Pyrinomonadaceae bacterium]
MILNKGEYNGARILAPYSVERMVSAHSMPLSQMRGIGWDINTSFSSNRGDLFPVGTFGHTGYTGTSIWIDPASKTFVVLLTNRVHPSDKTNITQLRSFVASIVAGSITEPPYAPVFDYISAPPMAEIPRAPMGRSIPPAGPLHPVLTGIDVLERDGFKQLEGRKVGLITNHTGRNRAGRSTIDVMAEAKNVKLVALFAPEHGLRGVEDNIVGNAKDEKTGLPVYSLYDKDRRKPAPEMLNGIDTLVFDIQDIGARFYTYISTCGLAMEEAARRNIKFVVLDRPNPINGYEIEGPVAESEFTGDQKYLFTSYHAIPVRHGMTVGELAGLFNRERKINADLTVIKMEGWRRADLYDGTALTWINPSPNMRSLTEALLYPGIGLLETTNLSVGRGTDTPFEIIGAPWIDGQKLAEVLNRMGLAGVRFVPVRFTPKSSKFANEESSGVNIIITSRDSFRPVATGIEIAYQLNRLYPGMWKVDDYLRLLVNRAALAALKQGK